MLILLTSFQILSDMILSNMILQYNCSWQDTMARSRQDLSQDCSKILTRFCQDITKISMESQPGNSNEQF